MSPRLTPEQFGRELSADTRGLHAWALGLLPLEASVELLVNSLNGRLLAGPWVRREGDRRWFDPDIAASESGYLSGGERRMLAIATSLAGGDPVDLSDAITGIDHDALRHVLAALARAGGATIETSASHAGSTAEPCTSPVVTRGIDAAPEGHAEDTNETPGSLARDLLGAQMCTGTAETSASRAGDTRETPASPIGDIDEP